MPIQHLNEFKAVLPTEEVNLKAEITGILSDEDKDPDLLFFFKEGLNAPVPEIAQHIKSDIDEINITKLHPDWVPDSPIRDSQDLVNAYLCPKAIKNILSDSITSEQKELPEFLNRFFEQLFITLNFWLSKENNKVFFFQQKIELSAKHIQSNLEKNRRTLQHPELWSADNQNKIIAMLLNAPAGHLPNIPQRHIDQVINEILGNDQEPQKRRELESVIAKTISGNFNKEIAQKQKIMVMRVIYRLIRSRKLIGNIVSKINSQPNNIANMAPNYLYDPQRKNKKDLYQVISAMLLPCLLEQYNLDAINNFDEDAPSARIEILMFDKICEPLINASNSLKRSLQKILMLSGYYKITEKGGIKCISHTEFDVLTNISGCHTNDGQTIEYPARGKNTNYAARNTLPWPLNILLLVPALLCWAYNRFQARVRFFQRKFRWSSNHAKAVARHTVGVARRKTKSELSKRLNKKNLKNDSFIIESENRARRANLQAYQTQETSHLLGASSSDESDLLPDLQGQIDKLSGEFEESISKNILNRTPTPTLIFREHRSVDADCVTPVN